ncbi:toll/interleukin-1 receptor domain-containing protein [Tessaracoccus caeni]|uniref:toll/interleukin-1 receptor domain-containing protein n=1 Tax=Tessaracoccus caeni TaxID=3031239 RepID=UPI0023DA1C2A|nr:toll/interleukin-1 receptor domain-containing protein [Tessaracoccus caeni]MDF1490303.1 toll/interleukin-1 receptor domain-containing protein [Tessaracoccus caeni]
MKVFISWSGTRSKALATALKNWLPLPLNYVEPFLSDKDIGAGERWAQTISGELESSNFGIICITPENVRSEWILFEAGALSKSMLDAKVVPLLFGLELRDLSGPLSQFQAQKVEKDGIIEIVRAINNAAEHPVKDTIVSRSLPALWPTLENDLASIPSSPPEEQQMRPQHEILEDLVTSVRSLSSRMRDFDVDAVREDLYRGKRPRLHPFILREISMEIAHSGDSATALLVLAGLFREDYPWLSEVFTDASREIRSGGNKVAPTILRRLGKFVKQLHHSPLAREFSGGSRDEMLMISEIPMILDLLSDLSDSTRASNTSELL